MHFHHSHLAQTALETKQGQLRLHQANSGCEHQVEQHLLHAKAIA